MTQKNVKEKRIFVLKQKFQKKMFPISKNKIQRFVECSKFENLKI